MWLEFWRPTIAIGQKDEEKLVKDRGKVEGDQQKALSLKLTKDWASEG